MKYNKKIKAFTLSEMIVVIMLTSIVVGLAFMVLTLVQKHITNIQRNINEIAEIDKLESSLWIDFNRYSKISFSSEKLKLFSEIDSISYNFEKDYVVKNKDTFFIPIESKEIFFEGKKANNVNIDAIQLVTTRVFQNQQIFVFKQNDAVMFIN